MPIQPTANRTSAEDAESEVGAPDHGAVARLKRLDDELRNRLRHPEEEAPQETPHASPRQSPPATDQPGWFARLPSLRNRHGLKSLLAIAVAVALGWYPIQRLLATTSAEATVNARLINLRAPIDGKVALVAPTLAVGAEVEPGETLLYIANSRADR